MLWLLTLSPNPAAAVELHEVSEHEEVEDADVDVGGAPYGDVDAVRSDEALEVVYDPNAEPLFH